MNSENLKNIAFKRAQTLLASKNIQKDIAGLCLLTKEQNPELNNFLLEELVFENIIQYFDDRQLDFYWYSYQNSLSYQDMTYKQAA